MHFPDETAGLPQAVGEVTHSAAAAALTHHLGKTRASATASDQLWNRSFPPLRLSKKESHLLSIPEPSRSVAGGHFCDLFLGVHRPTRLVLAMKRPRLWAHDWAAAERTKRYLKREGKTWSYLSHPNILPFCGLVEIESEMYLVSPWVAYGDLWGFLMARLQYLDIPPNERHKHPGHGVYSRYRELDMVLGIARGLDYLHSNGIIHGDLKALNVLLDNSLCPLLCDFDMTELSDSDYSPSSSDLLSGSGSLRWLAPELMTDSGQRKGMKSDIYAFSMTITEILTGQTPYPGLNFIQLAKQAVKGVRPSPLPREREGRDFDALWKVAAACWDPDPKERPSASAVVAMLTHTEPANPLQLTTRVARPGLEGNRGLPANTPPDDPVSLVSPSIFGGFSQILADYALSLLHYLRSGVGGQWRQWFVW